MGLFEFNVLPFALTGGPSAFQRTMDKVLCGLKKFKDNFIDDILVYSPDKESHKTALRMIFDGLRKSNLKLESVGDNIKFLSKFRYRLSDVNWPKVF